MPSTLVFDNATLSDAVAKASRIAPSKGAAFDKAAGLHIVASPSKRTATIRSTDLEVFYTQTIEAIEGDGDDAVWRIPSAILNDLMAGLPKGENHTITFIDRGDGQIRYKSGRVMAAFMMLRADEYPNFEQFTTKQLSEAQAMAARVDQVSWACDPRSQILNGVHIDGTRLIGCNQFSVAVVPCVAPVENPVTVPLFVLGGLLKGASDVRIAAEGRKFYVTLDDETQSFTNILEGEYPKIDRLLRTNFLGEVQVHKGSFLDALNLLIVLIKNERLPTVTLELDTSGLMPMMTFDMEVPGVGRMQNSMEVATEYQGDAPFRISFVPSMIQKAVEHCKGDQVTIGFGVEGDPEKRASVGVFDKSGYMCYVMPKEK